MSVFTITASDAWLTRLPERLAEELGYFKEADLQVEVRYPEPWNKVLEELDSGAAQCAADGIWLPSLYKKRVRDYYAFAQCAARFPMTLVARKPVDAFKWKDLEGKIVLVPGSNDAGMRMYFLGCAREGGADIGKIKYVPNFYAPMLYECFAGGWGDYVVMRSDLADQLIADGKGYPALDLTVNGGTVPWTVYYATADYLESSWETAGRFTAALAKAVAWLTQHGGDECRDVAAKYWPDLPADKAVALIDRYRQAGMWEGTAIPDRALARWQGFMADSLLVEKPLEYGEIVDVRPQEFAAGQEGGARHG